MGPVAGKGALEVRSRRFEVRRNYDEGFLTNEKVTNFGFADIVLGIISTEPGKALLGSCDSFWEFAWVAALVGKCCWNKTVEKKMEKEQEEELSWH